MVEAVRTKKTKVLVKRLKSRTKLVYIGLGTNIGGDLT